VKHRTYILSSRLSAESAIARIGELLAKEGVQYRKEGLSIFSTRTPIALLSFQRNRYSNKNWVGPNPFTFVSGVNVQCQLDNSGLTQVVVQVNQFRTFVWVAFWASGCGMAASAMPTPADAAIFFIALTLAAWFGLVSFLGGYLIEKEIADCLNS
jgi:hypothetical protein